MSFVLLIAVMLSVIQISAIILSLYLEP
jgi:hypothetical protein